MERTFGSENFTWRTSLWALGLCALWGGLTPSIKIALEGLPPLQIAGWRFLIGTVTLFCWARAAGLRLALPRSLRLWIVLFALIFVAQISLINIGTGLTASKYAIVLLNTSPLFVALMAHFLIPGDQLSFRKIGGLLGAFFGVALIFLGQEGASSLLGNSFALASGVLLAVIQVFAKFLVRDLEPIQVVFWEMALGTPLFFLLSFLFEPSDYHLTGAVVISVLYQGLVIAAFCFLSWIYLLRRFSASRLTAFQFTIPLFGVGLSWLVLGETLSFRILSCALLVAVGIYIVSTKRRSRILR